MTSSARQPKWRLLASTALVAVAALTSVAYAQEKTTITFANWASAEGTTREVIDKVIADFEAEHPDIDVVSESISFSEIARQLVLRARSGNPPDVSQISGNDTILLASTGTLEPLDGYITPELSKNIKPGALTADRVDQIAAKIKAAAKNSKILLDLRDTTGDPKQGIRLANFFIKEGTLATLQGQQFASQTFSADPAQFLTSAPVSVIVNRGTYGGPELAAAAIEDLKRGDVVGERTFGEGSFQKSIELPDGGDLLLTVAKYQSPSGIKIQDAAVTPTVAVTSPQEDEDEGAPVPKADEMLNKALDLLKAKVS